MASIQEQLEHLDSDLSGLLGGLSAINSPSQFQDQGLGEGLSNKIKALTDQLAALNRDENQELYDNLTNQLIDLKNLQNIHNQPIK